MSAAHAALVGFLQALDAAVAEEVKVFCFFFSKKKSFLRFV
jgi:hypothetical protein